MIITRHRVYSQKWITAILILLHAVSSHTEAAAAVTRRVECGANDAVSWNAGLSVLCTAAVMRPSPMAGNALLRDCDSSRSGYGTAP